ncbi:AraC family transcriptional regulator [uncultured Tateyamaria sp.]|uniref:AraC family transcriptional regulator n=1 Tax=Tateyamaria sp. 1078 TaxID=3417464 RepID=UPI00261A2FCD|nr:AraC family transcriptional regulator [uncultured Tateyamaria sp.]
MASVASIFATTLTRAAGLKLTAGGEVCGHGETLFRLNGPTADKIPDSAYFELIEWLRCHTHDDPALVFSYAHEIQSNDLGALGLAVKSAPTLRDSLQRLERYFRLITDTAVYSLTEDTDPALFALETRTPEHPALQLRDECALAAVAENVRAFGSSKVTLDHVAFRHGCRSDPQRFEAFFGCKVVFGAPHNAIAITPDSLDQPNKLGDRGISDFLTQHLDREIQQLPEPRSLRDTVLDHLASRLSDGVPSASDVATRMGMSERTFYRRLSDENLSYRDVLRDAQLSLAQDLLADSDCSIAEVAFLTGFSEQSTFSRAFKRWVGAAPAQFRQLSP